MNLDTFSMAALATELRAILLGGRVQRVTQVNSLTYGFELYIYPTRYYLLFSVEPQAPRLHLTYHKVRRGIGNETPLMLVLRKYMRGAKLREIEQPPYERILYFHFDSPFTPTTFAAEMIGTRSNLVLLEPDQTILGVARLPKSSGQGRQRALLPNNFYQPPPPQRKLLPHQLSELTLRQELAEASPQLALTRLLPEMVVGVSPLLAREIVYRATGRTATTVAELPQLSPLLKAFFELFEQFRHEQWQPTLALDEEEPLAFAPYALTHLPDTRPVETLSETIEIFFAEAASGYSAAKEPLSTAIAEARQRLARRRERLDEDAASQANPELLKEQGELILACAHQIRPGQTELKIEWLSPPLIIRLDPSLSPSENAQDYFARYRKGQRTAEEIPTQFQNISLEESYLDQLEQDLSMAEDRPEIDAVAGALAEAGYIRAKRHKKRQKQLSGRYLRLVAPDGAAVWVGKNALQNAHLTFDRASPDDLWLHARDVPGAHVVIPTAQGLPSEEDVLWAAGVAAYYSRARRDTSVEVAITLKKHVRAIKGAAPGLVTYRNETALRVTPQAPELEEADEED
jgi:predicted ribosome quality control (RQC) complex YloA/Tae2 family protein